MTAPAASRLRVRAPELAGRGWLNTGGRDVTLADLRGRIVVLDFWTFCCVNCLHVLDELRPLEEQYADSLVLIGVHSPKFEHEADPDALAAAVERYAVHHPVLDDPELVTWQAYTARAWPTLVVIDPEGYIVASMSGEGHAHGLSVLDRGADRRARRQGHAAPRRLAVCRAATRRDRAAVPGQGRPPCRTVRSSCPTRRTTSSSGSSPTSRPSAAASVDEARRAPARTSRRACSCCRPRRPSGSVTTCRRRLGPPPGQGAAAGRRRVDILAGTGRQLRERSGSGPALKQDLSTPWDLAWFIDRVVIAMAGTHQLWALHLAGIPRDKRLPCWAARPPRASATAPPTRRGLPSPRAWPPPPTASRLWVAKKPCRPGSVGLALPLPTPKP